MATPVQSTVAEALQSLKFESAGGMPGGPHEHKVTTETVEYIKSLEGKSVVVDSDGRVTVK